MRIVNRTEFLALPSGTVYRCTAPHDVLSIKYDTWTNDWIYTNFQNWESNDSGELWDRETEMINDPTVSYPLDLMTMRDGCYDENEKYVIYEQSDIDKIVAALSHE